MIKISGLMDRLIRESNPICPSSFAMSAISHNKVSLMNSFKTSILSDELFVVSESHSSIKSFNFKKIEAVSQKVWGPLVWAVSIKA